MNNKTEKMRLDTLLVERGFYDSRERAKSAVMAGEVMVGDKKIDKPGTSVAADAEIRLLGNKIPYVSRGGLKLAHAIESFNLDISSAVVLDIGSSTGGFVDCSLQNGASKVYSVDVGYGQLAWKLRNDDRVMVMEKTNARYLTEEQVPEAVDIVTVDASFISLEKILPAPLSFLKEDGFLVALIKPQFEAGRDKIGKKGVVHDRRVHAEVIENVCNMITGLAMTVLNVTYSPITGPEGNIEFLLLAQKNRLEAITYNSFTNERIKIVVSEAWEHLF